MKTLSDVMLFFGGCLFFGFRSWIGRQLLDAVFWSAKKLFRLTESEAEEYMIHKARVAELKRLNKPPVR